MKAINKSAECSVLISNKVNKVTKQKSVFQLYQIFLKNSYRAMAPRKNITHVIDGADVCGCAVWVRKGRNLRDLLESGKVWTSECVT